MLFICNIDFRQKKFFRQTSKTTTKAYPDDYKAIININEKKKKKKKKLQGKKQTSKTEQAKNINQFCMVDLSVCVCVYVSWNLL